MIRQGMQVLELFADTTEKNRCAHGKRVTASRHGQIIRSKLKVSDNQGTHRQFPQARIRAVIDNV